jgi:hypothetical protein
MSSAAPNRGCPSSTSCAVLLVEYPGAARSEPGRARGMCPGDGPAVWPPDGQFEFCRHRPGQPAGRRSQDGSHCDDRSPHTGRRGRCPAIPRQPRHKYAADLPHGLLAGTLNRRPSRPPTLLVGRALLPGPDPADFEPVSLLRGFHHWFLQYVHLPVSLAGPGPSGSADPSRRCRGCSHPPLRLQGWAAPSFTGLLRQPRGGPSIPPGQMAPRGARVRRETPHSEPHQHGHDGAEREHGAPASGLEVRLGLGAALPFAALRRPWSL